MIVKQVEDEEEAIAFFNAVNNCKPQIWRLEPNLILNKYISALTKQFNTNKKMLLHYCCLMKKKLQLLLGTPTQYESWATY